MCRLLCYIRNKDCAFEGEKIASADIPEVDKPVIPEVDVTGIQYIQSAPGFNVVLDKERNLSYVFTDNFSGKDKDWKRADEAMKRACENDNIILDLRKNEGGHRVYFMKYFYP